MAANAGLIGCCARPDPVPREARDAVAERLKGGYRTETTPGVLSRQWRLECNRRSGHTTGDRNRCPLQPAGPLGVSSGQLASEGGAVASSTMISAWMSAPGSLALMNERTRRPVTASTASMMAGFMAAWRRTRSSMTAGAPPLS